MVSPSAGAGGQAARAMVARRRAELRVSTIATGTGQGPGLRERECESVVCKRRGQPMGGPSGWQLAVTGRRRFLLVCGNDDVPGTKHPGHFRPAGPQPRIRRNRAHGRNGNTAHHYGINLWARGPADPLSAKSTSAQVPSWARYRMQHPLRTGSPNLVQTRYGPARRQDGARRQSARLVHKADWPGNQVLALQLHGGNENKRQEFGPIARSGSGSGKKPSDIGTLPQAGAKGIDRCG